MHYLIKPNTAQKHPTTSCSAPGSLTAAWIGYCTTSWLDVPDWVFFKLAVTVHRCLNGRALPYLSDYCVPVAGADTWRHLRSAKCQLYLQYLATGSTLTAVGPFQLPLPTVWNSLPDFISDPTISADCFILLPKTYLFARY